MEFINAENKKKVKNLLKISPLLCVGGILMGAALKLRVDLGIDYTSIVYLTGAIILSTGLSIFDYKVNGEVVDETKSKT